MALSLGLLAALQFSLPVDAAALYRAADSAGVPRDVMLAVAWMESRDGSRLNNYRGPGREQCDSLGCRRVCREIGRMQINPCIKWHIPACDSLTVYSANLRCGAAILRAARDGTTTWAEAIQRYNGSGKAAREYKLQALAFIGWLVLYYQHEIRQSTQTNPAPTKGSTQ